MVFCSECGNQVKDNAKFCGDCGSVQRASNSGEKITSIPLVTALNNDNHKVTLASKIGFFGLAIFLLILLILGSDNDSAELALSAGLIANSPFADANSDKQATTEKATQNQFIENADSNAVSLCSFNVNRTIYNLVFNSARVPPSIDIIGFYLQAKMQLSGVKLDQSKQTKSPVIAFDGTGVDSDSSKRLTLCVEKVPLYFTDGTKEDYLVAYLYDTHSSKYLSIMPINPDEEGKLIEWYKKVAAKNVRAFNSHPNTSLNYVGEIAKPEMAEAIDAIIEPAKQSNVDPKHTNEKFEIVSMDSNSAKLIFNNQTYEVNAGANVDIKHAVVKQIITIIRSHYSGDFTWESQRLGLSVIMSAKLEDNASLEDFMMVEFFK